MVEAAGVESWRKTPWSVTPCRPLACFRLFAVYLVSVGNRRLPSVAAKAWQRIDVTFPREAVEWVHAGAQGAVKNGRLVVDEPTDLPDGAEVEIVVIDDELTPAERAELHASLDRALDDSEAGRSMDAGEYLKQYRARREIVLLVEAQRRFEAVARES